MDISILEDLGLTQAEIKVYLTLLELGTSSAGTILKKCKLQNSVMHRALNSLIEKSLINFILEGRRKIYQATDPEHFFNFIDDKKTRFQQILPELKKKQTFAKKKETATIYRGIRGIKEVYSIMINTEAKEYNTFGGGYPCVNLMGESWWKNSHLRRVEKKLPSRQVFDETVKKQGDDYNKLPLTKVKFLSKEFFQAQETVIVGDKVAIAVFTDNPYAFLIEDKVVANGYRKHFEVLWKLAKK
jgi:sugar-specific transcriptional regulator TrmB